MSDLFGGIFNGLSGGGEFSFDTIDNFWNHAQTNLDSAINFFNSSSDPATNSQVSSPGEGVSGTSLLTSGFTSGAKAYTEAERSNKSLSNIDNQTNTGQFKGTTGASKPKTPGAIESVNPLELEQEWLNRMRKFGQINSVSKSTASNPNSIKSIISSES